MNKNMNKTKNYVYKVILVGDTNTGKTTICNTLMGRKLQTMQYQPTIGIDFNALTEKICKNKYAKIHLWDTAGQEKFRCIINSYYRNTCGTILTYNVTNRQSFLNITSWLNDIEKYNNCTHDYKHPILLLGTCRDLEKNRKVKYEEGLLLATSNNNIIFREITSFNRKGPLEDGFIEFLRLINLYTESDKYHSIENIPKATPINGTKKYMPLSQETDVNDIIRCKGVKYLNNNFEIETNIDNNFQLRTKQPESKICNTCN